MPGKMRHVVIAGEDYEVPEENYEALVGRLGKAGIQFGSPKQDEEATSGSMQPGGPPKSDDPVVASGRSAVFSEPDPTGAVGGGDDSGFRQWYGGVSKKLNLAPDPDDKEHYYDYRGFYDAMNRGEVKSPDQPGGHWDSKFKSPDHPRAFLLDPESGRYFDTETGKYTGGAKEAVPGDRMDRLNKTDLQDLSPDEWAEAKGGSDAPDKRPKWLRSLVSAFEGNEKRNAAVQSPFYGGMAHGLTMGTAKLLPGEAGENARKADEGFRSENPGLYRVGDSVGSLISPANFGGGSTVAQGAPLLARAVNAAKNVGTNALSSGVQEATRSYADADPELPAYDRAINALKTGARDAGLTAALGGALKLGGATVGAVSNLVSGGARGVADRARLHGGGISADDLGAYAQRNDLSTADARRQFVDNAERLVPPNTFVPRSAETIEKQYAPVLDELNTGINDRINQAQAAGARLPADTRAAAVAGLRSKARDAIATGYEAAGAPALLDVAGKVGAAARATTPQDVRTLKSGWDAQAFKGVPGTPESFTGKANLAAANQYRDILDDYVRQGGPDVYQGFRGLNDDYGVAATMHGGATRRALQQATSGGGESAALSGAGAIANRVVNNIPGAGLIPEAVANTAALTSRVFNAGGAVSNALSESGPAAVRNTQALLRKQPPPQQGQTDAYAQTELNGNSRGHLLQQNIERIMQTNPEALGPYRQQFENALDPSERVVIYERLARSKDDPEFQRSVMPLINGTRR